MRALSSSVMAALVVIALFWGNCFSCPQALLAMTQQQPAHQCCHHQKKSDAGCETQNLQQFVKADLGSHAPVMALAPAISLSIIPVYSEPGTPIPVESLPPGSPSLHTTLRV